MREIGISPRFSRDKFVPLQTKQRYSTRDISGEVSLTLFFRGFVPFLSLADFVSRNKNLQVADLQRLKSCFGELVTATTSNLQNAAVFWALDDKHPFKRDLLRVFKIGRKYKASEIQELTAPIVKYHLHKTIKQRASVSLLKALFLVERPKIYLIKGKNPMGFKKHGPLRIPKTEENLLKYFLL